MKRPLERLAGGKLTFHRLKQAFARLQSASRMSRPPGSAHTPAGPEELRLVREAGLLVSRRAVDAVCFAPVRAAYAEVPAACVGAVWIHGVRREGRWCPPQEPGKTPPTEYLGHLIFRVLDGVRSICVRRVNY